ncbi:hypothetical protein WAI453_003043 [Rhynchosporium graminicola]|uniref:Enoyl-CoA hydratase n=1 Tax=Rhynchosporium graminicola TaxID=2792576 RepID=A0A1E1LJD4_9HELO|nr:uncharacterized protein RCO7_11346 [Rhynchosporium commune]
MEKSHLRPQDYSLEFGILMRTVPSYLNPRSTIPAEKHAEPWLIVETGDGYEISLQRGTIRICLDRPGGNPLTLSMMRDIAVRFKKFSTDPSVRRIIVTGRGRYFCTGMDLKEDLLGSVAERKAALDDLFASIDNCPKLTIAVVNGPAIGGGVGIVSVCDVRLAVSSSYFCLGEVRLGLCPATISKYLVRELGPSLARAAMMTGRRMPSQILYQSGFLHVLEHDMAALDKYKEEFLTDMRLPAPQASAWCKELVRAAISADDATANEIFTAMLGKDSESSHGVEQFRKGVKEITWEKLDR